MYNSQVEMLYQRYFLRTNQNHMTHLLWLLLTLGLTLGSLQLVTRGASEMCSLALLGSSAIYAGKWRFILTLRNFFMKYVYSCKYLQKESLGQVDKIL